MKVLGVREKDILDIVCLVKIDDNVENTIKVMAQVKDFNNEDENKKRALKDKVIVAD